jgi:hypothetical protein
LDEQDGSDAAAGGSAALHRILEPEEGLMRLIVGCSLVLLVGACAPMPPVVAGPQRELTGSFAQGRQGFEGVRMAVRVNTVPGSTGAAIGIGGAASGATHPWHIHRGTCASGGPIVGDPAAYPALQVGANGNATASATIRVGLEAGQSYHVNVHQSPQNLGTIVGCTDLR